MNPSTILMLRLYDDSARLDGAEDALLEAMQGASIELKIKSHYWYCHATSIQHTSTVPFTAESTMVSYRSIYLHI